MRSSPTPHWPRDRPRGRQRPALAAVLLGVPLAACPSPPAEQGPLKGAGPAGAPDREAPRFEEITEQSGIDFVHRSGIDGSYFFPEHVGSGGALFDDDGDGDLDLFLVNSGFHEQAASPTSISGHRLFRQEGSGRFVDRTAAAGVSGAGYGMGSTVGDFDADGDLDLYLTNYGRDALYRNDGDGRFSELMAAAGPSDQSWSTSACFFDPDLDGDLDLYVATYVHHHPPKACTDRAGRLEYCGPAAFRAVPDLLYRNLGDGRFVEAAAAAGIAARPNRGLGVICTDLDGDLRPDVYVANDGEPNQLWINQGDGTFEDRALLMGAGLNAAGKPEASMGIALGDVDGDLALDLFLSHLDRETNTLYRGGPGGFGDDTARWRLGADSLPYTGFGTALFDPDLDGDLDLLVANGRVRRGPILVAGKESPVDETAAYRRAYAEPNLFFVNQGGTFRNATAECGGFCRRIEVSRSLLVGDLDLDGAQDLVLTNSNGPARVYRTRSPASRRWMSLAVSGSGHGRSSLGARLLLTCSGRTRLGLVTSAYGYLGAVEPLVHFGLGDEDSNCDSLLVQWPDGRRRRYFDLPVDHRVQIVRRH